MDMVVDRCPDCSLPLVEDRRHCAAPACPWLRCDCGRDVHPNPPGTRYRRPDDPGGVT